MIILDNREIKGSLRGAYGDMPHIRLSDCRQCHRPVDCADGYDEREDYSFARNVGSASRLFPGPSDTTGNRLHDQAAAEAAS